MSFAADSIHTLVNLDLEIRLKYSKLYRDIDAKHNRMLKQLYKGYFTLAWDEIKCQTDV